jgi:hypothetical protein
MVHSFATQHHRYSRWCSEHLRQAKQQDALSLAMQILRVGLPQGLKNHPSPASEVVA